jgi:hypothetical protein
MFPIQIGVANPPIKPKERALTKSTMLKIKSLVYVFSIMDCRSDVCVWSLDSLRIILVLGGLCLSSMIVRIAICKRYVSTQKSTIFLFLYLSKKV